MLQRSYDEKPKLYLVPTPIGNLEDITLRSLNILKESDVIFSEDTRVTRELLDKYNIKNKLISSHKFNEEKNIDKLLEYLKEKKTISVVSDRGMPVISDPGFPLAKAAIENNYNVICLPGPSAFIVAAIDSGLVNGPFMFYGFLNRNKEIKELEDLKNYKYPIIFYESPHRITKTLINIRKVFGNRNASIVREISKKYEEINRDTLDNLIEYSKTIKGEIVIVVEGNKENNKFQNLSIIDHIKLYLDEGLPPKEAIKKVSKERNIKKSIVYDEYLKYKEK